MILKICRKKSVAAEKEGSIEVITEFYSGNSFKEIGGSLSIDDKTSVIMSDYTQLDEITGEFIKYETEYAFIMNDEGKTIERLI